MSESPTPESLPRATLPLVIGLGNEHRSDDRLGLEVARALKSKLRGKVHVEECTSGGVALLDLWRGFDRVLVVDAIRSGSPGGTVHRLEAGDGALPGFHSATSTHGLSLGEAVALGKGLGNLPRQLVVYGVEAENLEMGVALSPSVRRGVEEATARILAELDSSPSTDLTSVRSPAHA